MQFQRTAAQGFGVNFHETDAENEWHAFKLIIYIYFNYVHIQSPDSIK